MLLELKSKASKRELSILCPIRKDRSANREMNSMEAKNLKGLRLRFRQKALKGEPQKRCRHEIRPERLKNVEQ